MGTHVFILEAHIVVGIIVGIILPLTYLHISTWVRARDAGANGRGYCVERVESSHEPCRVVIGGYAVKVGTHCDPSVKLAFGKSCDVECGLREERYGLHQDAPPWY